MGTRGSGKTSMRSIIFANYIAQDTSRLGFTVNIENSHIKFLGNLTLALWDCGGHLNMFKKYLTSQRDHIFGNVEVLIYVLDVMSKEENEYEQYKQTLEAIHEFSPKAKVFCLIHKMDLVSPDQREISFQEKETVLRQLSLPMNIFCFQTSIWDETLYKAWSSVVSSLIPNADELEAGLDKFCLLSEVDEVVIFEKATFLVISDSICSKKTDQDRSKDDTMWRRQDPHRYEKISYIIKQFKLSCSKLSTQFRSMQVRNSNFSAYIDEFTPNTYIMVVSYDTSIQSAATLINISVARKLLDPLVTNY